MPHETKFELQTELPCAIRYSVSAAAVEHYGLYTVMERAKHRMACAVVGLVENNKLCLKSPLVMADSDKVNHGDIKDLFDILFPF